MDWGSLDVLAAVQGFSWLVYIWDLHLSIRQRKLNEIYMDIPGDLESVYDENTLKKSFNYSVDVSRCVDWFRLYVEVRLSLLLWFRGLTYLVDISDVLMEQIGYDQSYEIMRSIIFAFVMHYFQFITNLPWMIYFTFVIEKQYGFSEDTLGGFIFGQWMVAHNTWEKEMYILSITIFAVKNGGQPPYCYIYGWAAAFVTSLMIFYLFFQWFIPFALAEAHTPLEDGMLKQNIEGLAHAAQFPLKSIVINNADVGGHANAFMMGFHTNSRIVLNRALLDDSLVARADDRQENALTPDTEANRLEQGRKKFGCNADETVGIVAHELGHWNHSHNLILHAADQAIFCLQFLLCATLMDEQDIFIAFGFAQLPIMYIRYFILSTFMLYPINTMLLYVRNGVSQRNEFQADEFAVRCGKGKVLQSGLIQIHKTNLEFPVVYWMCEIRRTHPALMERLKAIEVCMRKIQ